MTMSGISGRIVKQEKVEDISLGVNLCFGIRLATAFPSSFFWSFFYLVIIARKEEQVNRQVKNLLTIPFISPINMCPEDFR